MLRYVTFLLLTFFVSVFAQNKNSFNVESFEIVDSLTSDDQIEKDLGRYNNFEIHLNKGDKVAINLKTDKFAPLILLVSPQGEKFVYPSKDGKEVAFTQNVNETGNWNLFVIGGENDTGNYVCKIGFADSGALNFSEMSNLCEFLKFVASHARADFVFLKENLRNVPNLPPRDELKILDAKLTKKNELFLKCETANAESEFAKISETIYDCFEDWNVKESRRRKTSEGYISSITAIQSGAQEPVLIRVSLVESPSGKFIRIKSARLK